MSNMPWGELACVSASSFICKTGMEKMVMMLTMMAVIISTM